MSSVTTGKRYVVRRGTDSTGNKYATGPLTFLETDDFGAAQREVVARGGEVLDLTGRMAWSQGLGWYDAADYLESVGL